jgi:hypothetical protein
MIAGAYPGRDNYVWITAACLFGLFFILSAIISWKGGMTVRRQSAQFFMLLLVVILSVALPAAVAWRFGPEGFWLDTSLGAVARFIQLAFMSLACMVPGLLFFLFDRQRLSTLRDRFEQQIFRLDPNVATLADVYARFGSQIDETYGQVGEAVETRLTAQRRWPIIVATVALALGWIITLLPVGDLANTTTSDQVAQTFLPQSNAVSYGFLGAYFFSINLVLRRYARGDLRPKAYSAITVRILIVVILGWLIDTTIVEPPQWLLLAAFFIGIVPETFLTFFREVYRGQLVARFAQSLDEALPLQHLEGLDLYDRARLLDEGVTNIEALAHHDLIDLLLETRIPAGRLVDWVDQAILYLHLVNPLSEDGARHAYAASRQSLRKLGIRTATDLESVYNGHENGALLNALRKALSPNAEGADGKALSGNAEDGDGARLEILLASFQDDEWMKYVRNWRRRAMLWERTIEIDADGKIVEDQSKEITSVGVTGQDV